MSIFEITLRTAALVIKRVLKLPVVPLYARQWLAPVSPTIVRAPAPMSKRIVSIVVFAEISANLMSFVLLVNASLSTDSMNA